MPAEGSNSIFDTILFWSTNLLLVAVAIWIVLSIFDYFRRRSLNLTEAETVHHRDVKPGFLTVDHEKRQAALEGGKQFDADLASRSATAQPVGKVCAYARMITLGLAALSLITGVIGALLRVRFYDQVVKDYGTWDSAVAIVTKYPIGFAIAAIVIVVAIINFARLAQGHET